MGLSSDLISQFVKATKDDKQKTKETTVYGTIVEYDGGTYVRLDGSDLLTPISTTTDAKPGERVTVMIKNHTATVTGNISSPAARTDTVREMGSKISEFEIIVAHRVVADDIEAVNARIENLVATVGTFTSLSTNELEAIYAEIETIQSSVINTEYLTATDIKAVDAEIENLRGTIAEFESLSTTDLEAVNADIDNLKAYFADFTYVSTDVLEALKANIKELDTTKLTAQQADLKYANIDFTNIGEAAMERFYASSGLIKDVTIDNQTITGHLVGVTISGNLIEGETIKADKLVIKEPETGLYYKLNVAGGTFSVGEAVPSDSLHGSVITARSITAEKVSVSDLIAFKATIAGIHMDDFGTHKAIYSFGKESVDNITEGFYMDSQGQLALGDANNYLKYFKDTDGSYKLVISSVDKLEIGGRNLLIGTSTGEGWNYGGFDRDTNTFTIQNGPNTITDTTLTVYSSNTTIDGTTLDISDISSTVSDNLLTINPSTQWVHICNQEVPVTLEANRDYTLSFHIKRDSPISTANLRIMDVDPNVSEDIILERTGIVFEVGSFVKYQVTFTPEETHASSAIIQFDLSGSSSGVTTLSVKDIKLEVGNKATDYTPAPEDVEWKMTEKSDQVREYVLEQSASIIQTCEEIVQTASKEYVTTSEYGQFKTTTESELKTAADNISMNFNTTKERIDGVENSTNSRFDELKKHIKFDQNGITISAGENAMTLRLDNDVITFEKNGEQFGWWDGVDFYTGNIVVAIDDEKYPERRPRAQFGNFAFTPMDDGSLKFLKVQ